MDDVVARSIAKWPDVPDVYGWLALDRRGNWRIKGERIANVALREFIARIYEADSRGCWFFQNGPQRVYVELEAAPWVWRLDAGVASPTIASHTGLPAQFESAWLDEQGRLLSGEFWPGGCAWFVGDWVDPFDLRKQVAS